MTTQDAAAGGLSRSQRRRERLSAEAISAEVSQIQAMHAPFMSQAGVPELFAQAVREGVDPETASKRLLEHIGRDYSPARPEGAVPHVEWLQGDHEADRRKVAAEAVYAKMTRTVPKSPEARRLAGMSAVELARETLAWHGARRDDFGSPLQTINAAITHGSGDFPYLLEETGRRLLREAYLAAPMNLKAAGRQVIAEDFRPMYRLQLSEAPALKKVAEFAEYTHGSMAEGKESYGLETFGRMFSISRKALINDDLGAFSQAARRFGAAAAEFEAQYLVDLLTSGSGNGPTMADGKALFHADHGNKAASGATIDVTTIGAAFKAMRLQKGLDSLSPINVTPKFLVVPAALEMVALQYGAAISAADSAKVNPFAGALTLIVDPRLDAKSATRWYVAADPGVIDGLEFAHLGDMQPMVETREGWEIDGLQFKVRLDFGAAFIDHRSWFMNPGA